MHTHAFLPLPLEVPPIPRKWKLRASFRKMTPLGGSSGMRQPARWACNQLQEPQKPERGCECPHHTSLEKPTTCWHVHISRTFNCSFTESLRSSLDTRIKTGKGWMFSLKKLIYYSYDFHCLEDKPVTFVTFLCLHSSHSDNTRV